jgi:hypothetical protein
MDRVFAIVIDGLMDRRRHDTPFLTQRSARIWVHVEAWKVAADIQPDAIAGLEDIASGIELECEFVHLPRRQEFSLLPTMLW